VKSGKWNYDTLVYRNLNLRGAPEVREILLKIVAARSSRPRVRHVVCAIARRRRNNWNTHAMRTTQSYRFLACVIIIMIGGRQQWTPKFCTFTVTRWKNKNNEMRILNLNNYTRKHMNPISRRRVPTDFTVLSFIVHSRHGSKRT